MKKKLQLVIVLVVAVSFIVSSGVVAKTNPEKLLQDTPVKEDYPQAGAIYLENKTVADHTGEESKIRRRKVIKVFNKRGVEDYGEFEIRFNKKTEDIKLKEVKTIKQDGTVMEPKEDAINEITPPEAAEASLYSDARIKVISMSGVEPGSILVCDYVKTKQKYGMEDEFWNYQLFQYTDPVKERELVVKTPADEKINHKVKNGELKPEIEENNGVKTYTWKKQDIPAVVEEDNMPSLLNIAPLVEISTVDSWEEVSNWYQGLIDDQYQVNEEIKDKIEELTKNAETTEEEIEALYNYVTSQIRYIGLQFGESGYKPYSAEETFENKYGVCKEKATLLIAMLREIGVEAEPVLIRRGSAEVDLDIASPALFNHMIVYLPGQDKYLDPTSKGTKYGVLPGDQGKKILLPESNKLAKTPVRDAENSRALISQQVTLNQDGSAQIVYQEEYRGIYGYSYKRAYQKYTPRQQKRLIKKGISRGFSNAQAEGIQIEGVEELETELKIKISDLKAQQYAKPMGNMLSFKPLRFSLGLNKYAASESRNYPLYFGFKRQAVREVEIDLPEGYQVNYLPENVEFENEIGKLRVEYQQQEGKVITNLNLIVDRHLIETDEYQAARELFNKAGTVEQNQILIEKK